MRHPILRYRQHLLQVVCKTDQQQAAVRLFFGDHLPRQQLASLEETGRSGSDLNHYTGFFTAKPDAVMAINLLINSWIMREFFDANRYFPNAREGKCF